MYITSFGIHERFYLIPMYIHVNIFVRTYAYMYIHRHYTLYSRGVYFIVIISFLTYVHVHVRICFVGTAALA